MNYEYKEKKFDASFITAGDELLLKNDRRRTLQLCDAPYIWVPFFTRLHLFSMLTFEIFDCVKCEFQCDNQFDLIINGKTALKNSGETPFYSGVFDVTEYFKSGKNTVALRLFQSSGFTYSAALRGSFAVYRGEEVKYFPVHEGYDFRIPCMFGEGTEKEGWDTAPEFQNPWNNIRPQSYAFHPRLLRHSLYFRKSFLLEKEVKKATLSATALGLFVPYLNGEEVTDDLFLPGAMERVPEYTEIDVTAALKPGRNTWGFLTGNGWYNCESWGSLRAERNAVLGELSVVFSDGSEMTLKTDESFSCALSPYVENDIQYGERYDSRLALENWAHGDTHTERFFPVKVLDRAPLAALHNYPQVKTVRRLKPTAQTTLRDGSILFDFSENTTGRCSIRLFDTKPGAAVEIGYCERLDADGQPIEGVYGDVFYPQDTEPCGRSKTAKRNRDVYICSGKDVECYEPKFAYTGYRYIFVKGLTPKYEISSRVMHSDLSATGEVKSSCEKITALWDIITRTFRNNILAGPTDCPTREKNFWNGDISAFAYTAMWYMDCRAFLGRWSHLGRKMERGVYGWEDEEYILPLKLWRFYGDVGIVKQKFPAVLELIRRREAALTKDTLIPKNSARYRDHLSLSNVPEQFFGYAFHTYMYKAAAQMAEILQEDAYKAEFLKKYAAHREKFQKEFYLKDEGDYTPHCQGGIILPMMLGLCDEADRERLLKKLCSYAETDGQLTTGFLTTESLLMLLSEAGRLDLGVAFLLREEYPSWLYLIKTGATTITETWKGHADPDRMASMDHYTFGSVGRFIFETLGGLKAHTADFHEVTVKPYISKEIGDLEVSYRTDRGKIVSAWRVHDKTAEITVSLPSNTSATVLLPDGETHRISGPGEFQKTVKLPAN